MIRMRYWLSAILLCTLMLGVVSIPTIHGEEPGVEVGIWDRCESFSVPERMWREATSTPAPSNASLSIDSSIKSPMGTGSIRIDFDGSSGYFDLYIMEYFNEDQSLTKDFIVARPRSIFVLSSRAVEWTIEVVTREQRGTLPNWNPHQVARQTVPANTTTEIILDYSGIPVEALRMTAQVNIIVSLQQQVFTGYIMGITEEVGGLGTLVIDTYPMHTEVFVNGMLVDITPQSVQLFPGSYLVSFEQVPGYTPPVATTVTIVANQTTEVIGTYVRAFTIEASAGLGGSLTPSGSITVNDSSDQVFTITPEEGYHIVDVVVDGSSVGPIATYTFASVSKSHTIYVSFAANAPTIPPGYIAGALLFALGLAFLAYPPAVRRMRNRNGKRGRTRPTIKMSTLKRPSLMIPSLRRPTFKTPSFINRLKRALTKDK